VDDAETALSGSAFQILAATTGKGRLPIVDSLKGGGTRRSVAVGRSVENAINLICANFGVDHTNIYKVTNCKTK